MSTYGDQGYEQALEEIELEFGCSEEGDPLTHEQYKSNLIDFIYGNTKNEETIPGLWKKGIFDLEDIILEDWAENRRMPAPV